MAFAMKQSLKTTVGTLMNTRAYSVGFFMQLPVTLETHPTISSLLLVFVGINTQYLGVGIYEYVYTCSACVSWEELLWHMNASMRT